MLRQSLLIDTLLMHMPAGFIVYHQRPLHGNSPLARPTAWLAVLAATSRFLGIQYPASH